MGRGGGGSSGGSRSSGGSSGGSRSSGGSSSGSRSSGGRSGGGSSSGSSGRGSSRSSGGFFNKPSGRVFPSTFGGGGFSGGGSHPGGGYSAGGRSAWSGRGCITLIFVLMILVIIGVSIVFIMTMNRGEPAKSTIQRVALPAGSVNETGFYTDELGWISNETKLLTGMKHFYQETGVQPYLYIMDTVNGSHHPTESELDDFANDLYDELFTDEAHLLLVFFEYNNAYMDRYVCGVQAKTVIDDEAAGILLDYIDRYYYDSSLTEEEFFSKAFSEAADRIMTVTRSPWISVLFVLALVALAVVLFTWWNNARRQKNLEAERMEEMLNKPLEKFDDVEVAELAKKYEDPDPK